MCSGRGCMICNGCCFGFFAIILILSTIISLAIVPNVMQNEIEKRLKFSDDNEIFDLWKDTPIPYQHMVYIFNVRNWVEVMNGVEKPRVEEKGPYEFGQLNTKSKFQPISENVLKFNEKELFGPENSLTSDEIHVMNVALYALLSWVEMNRPDILPEVNTRLVEIFPDGTHEVILKTTPQKLLIEGIEFCKSGLPDICANFDMDSKFISKYSDGTMRFSFFQKKIQNSGADFEDVYEISRGVDDIQNLAAILTWNGKEKMDTWNSTCNDIRGTDGVVYAPSLKTKDQRHVFNKEICRSFTLYSDGESTVNGSRAYRLKAGVEMLSSTGENDCFCSGVTQGITEANNCLKRGAMELYRCTGVHMVLTFPHFLLADDSYANGVDGLLPDAVKHEYISELDRYFGFLLRGGKRIQYNMFMRKIDPIDVTHKVDNPVLLPIVWIDERIYIPSEISENLSDVFYKIIDLFDMVKWIFIGVSGGITALTGIALIVYAVK